MARRVTRMKLPGLAAGIFAIALAGCATTAPSARLSDLTALQQRADGAYAHHHWQAAAGAYQALAKSVPADAAYWFRLGNSYARLQQLQPAVDAYRAALQRDPRIVPAWHNLGSVLLEQSQAAFQEAANHAEPVDPLKRTSALLAERIGRVRTGASGAVPSKSRPALEDSAPAPASTLGAKAKPQGAGP